MSVRHVDMYIRYTGGTFKLVRNYESVHTNPNRQLGNRWMTNLEASLSVRDGIYSILLENLHLERFKKTESGYESLRKGDKSVTLSDIEGGYLYWEEKTKKAWVFDTNGKLQEIQDKNDNQIRFTYRGKELSQVYFSGGETLTFTWRNKKVASITDRLGRKVSYEYEGELLTTVICSDEGILTYRYTPEGWLAAIRDQNGKNYVENHYDRKGRVIRQTLSTGEEFVNFYDEEKRQNTFLTVSTSARKIYIYDGRKLPIKIIYDDDTYTETGYDACENIIYERDRKGNEIHREYTNTGNLLREELPNGLITQWEYDENGNVIVKKDNTGTYHTYRYDKVGNLIKEKEKLDETREKTTTYEKDRCGRITKRIDALGNAEEYRYGNGLAKPFSYKDREGNIYYYEYDKAGRLIELRNPLGTRTYGYDYADWLAYMGDEENNVTHYRVDYLGNITGIIYPESYHNNAQKADIQYEYDDLDNLIRTIDATGVKQETLRDEQGRIVKESTAEAGSYIQYSYNTDDKVEKIETPDGGITRLWYDVNGNIIKKILPAEYNKETDSGACYYTQENRKRHFTREKSVSEFACKSIPKHRFT